MSTVYDVSINLSTSGDLEGKLGTSHSKMLTMEGTLGKIRDGFTGIVEKAGAVALSIGTWAGAGALGAVTYSIVHINKELETTGISMAAIFGANGFSKNMAEGMTMSSDILAKMRKDAAALPGEFGDLVGIYRTIATPGFQAGLDPDKLRDFSARTMATGAVMGLPMEVVGREMAMLLEGRAGAHNMLGLRLAGLGGDAAKAFNTMSAEKRLEFLNTQLDKYKDSIEVFSHSFEGLWTSAVDNGKNFGKILTEGVFGKMKGTLEDVNAWFTENQLAISNFAQALGSKLSKAYDIGVEKIKEWWPAIETFATNAWERIVEIWERVQPYVDRFGVALKDALKDPGTIDKLVHLLELYAAVKVVGAVGGIGGIVGAASGIGSAVGTAGAYGKMGMALLGISTAELATVGAVLAGVGLAAWQASKAITEFGKDWSWSKGFNMAQHAGTGYGKLSNAGDVSNSDAVAMAEAGERRLAQMYEENLARDKSTAGINYWDVEYQKHMSKLIEANNVLGANMLLTASYTLEFKRYVEDRQLEEDNQYFLDRLTAGMPGALAAAQVAADRKAKTPKHPGGAGVNINRVEINVAGNEDPSRVAYKIHDLLANLKRNPRTSSFVPNYSAAVR